MPGWYCCYCSYSSCLNCDGGLAVAAARVCHSPLAGGWHEDAAAPAALLSYCTPACLAPSAGQKGSDVTAREATRKMVSAATQLDALEKVAARVDGIAAAHGVEVQHMQRPHQLPAGGAAAGKAGAADAAEHQEQEGLVPRSASAVVQPNLWQPKNTIVRGAFKESVATRTGMLAAVAAGVPVGQSAAGGGAAAGGLGAGVNVGGASAAGMMTKGDMFAAAGAGGDAASRRLVGPDVLLAAMQQQQQMLTQSADQECRIDQSHKQHRGR